MQKRLISRLTSQDYWDLGKRFSDRAPGAAPSLSEFDLNGIARAIADRRAVLWVGAGVSMAAGAPSWKGLLKGLLDVVIREQHPRKAERKWIKRLHRTEQFLQLADYLSNALGNTLHEHVQQKISLAQKRTSLHQEIARIPFDIVITTNYDSLLEQAFEKKVSVFTWKQPGAFLYALRGVGGRAGQVEDTPRHLPLVLKLHGTIEDPSTIILSSSGYRDIQHGSDQLRDALKHLLLTRQFIFVGTSLTDPHLLGLLDETLAEHGRAQVGDHYAILPASEAPVARQAVLRDTYSIRVVTFNDKIESKRSEPLPEQPEYLDSDIEYVANLASLTHDQLRRIGTRHVMNMIAGLVAARNIASDVGFPVGPVLDLRRLVQHILDQAIATTGSDRGDVCLIEEEPPFTPVYAFSRGPTVQQLVDQAFQGFRVPPDCVCGAAFYRCSKGEVLYIPNVNTLSRVVPHDGDRKLAHGEDKPKIDEVLQGKYGDIRYVIGSSEMRSELAAPIFSEGGRVGVLNLESKQLNAFSNQEVNDPRNYTGPYKTAILHYAEKIGAVYSLARSLQSRTRRIQWYAPPDAQKSSSRQLSLKETVRDATGLTDLEFVVYEANYLKSGLRSVCCTKPVPNAEDWPIWFRFDQTQALAVRTFLGESRCSFPDAEEAGQSGAIDGDSRRKLGVTGPVFGEQIYSEDVVAGVFVGWLPNGERKEVPVANQQLTRRILRALFSIRRSDLDSAHKDILRLRELKVRKRPVLAPVAERLAEFFHHVQEARHLTNRLQGIETILQAFLQFLGPHSLICQCRLFVRADLLSPRVTPSQEDSYELKSFLTYDHEHGTVSRRRKPRRLPLMHPDRDGNLRFLMTRCIADPLTRAQSPNLYGKDLFAKELNKLPGRAWLASPIVRLDKGTPSNAAEAAHNLLGYMTLDDHPAIRKLSSGWDSRFFADDAKLVPIMCDYVSGLLSVLLGEGL